MKRTGVDRGTLAAILTLSVAVRLGAALGMGDAVEALPGIHDQLSYDALARRLVAGEGFSFGQSWWPATRPGEPTAHWSYLYTGYLAAVYALFGPDPLVARLIQASLAGLAHPWLAWRIGARIFGARVGLAAAGLTALYPYFVYYAAALMTETFYILAILAVVDLATGALGAPTHPRIGRSQRLSSIAWAWPFVALGLAVGMAVLLRQTFVLLVPVLFAWLLKARAGSETSGTTPRRMATGLLIAGFVSLAMIAPWTVRNYQAFGRFVPLNTNAGFAFYWANHPIHGTDFVSVLPAEVYRDLIPNELRNLNEAELDAALLRLGLGFVLDDPLRYLRLSISRIDDYFKFWPSPESSAASNLARSLSFGLSLPFMLCGLRLSMAGGAGLVPRERQAAIVLLWLLIGSYSLLHILSWALIRYRLPVDALLVLFTAFGLVQLAERLGRPRLAFSLETRPGPPL